MSNSDGRLLKMELDYAPICDVQLPAAQQLATDGQLCKALDQLMALEKSTRNSGDLASNTRVQIHIIKLCLLVSNWSALNENIIALCKKHGAFKQATQKMIEEAVTFVEKMPSKETKLELVKTLRIVTEGKIYVEVERARLTRILSQIKEEEGDISEAANILQELQVETFGSMEKREKTDFLLEQMRLCLAKNDLSRTLVISRKISTKFLNLLESQDLKLRFYKLMIKLYIHDCNYLEICKCYRQVLGTPSVLQEQSQWREILSYAVLFVVLSPYDKEQSELIQSIIKHELLEKMPILRDFLKLFIRNELIDWKKIEQQHGSQLRSSYVFNESLDEGKARWKDFHRRITEHNLRVIAKCYTMIRSNRLSELLGLSASEVEEFVSGLVSSGTIYAKIDRPSGIVSFQRPLSPEEILNEWSGNIHELLKLLEKTTHLITKEEMVNNLLVVNEKNHSI